MLHFFSKKDLTNIFQKNWTNIFWKSYTNISSEEKLDPTFFKIVTPSVLKKINNFQLLPLRDPGDGWGWAVDGRTHTGRLACEFMIERDCERRPPTCAHTSLGGGHDACRSLGRCARRLAAASALSWHRDSSGDPLLSPRRVMEAWAAGQPWRT
jgi:hypothetical protein